MKNFFQKSRLSQVILMLMILMLPFQLFAQKKITPTVVDKNSSPSLSKVFKKYDLFSINTAEIRSFANSNSKGFSEFEFEFKGYPTFPISIYENDLLSDDYKAFSGDETGKRLLPKMTAKTYSGSISGNANSAVYLTLADNLIDGLVKQNDKTYLIEPLRYFEKSADASVYVLYEAGDVIPHSGMTCGLTEANEHHIEQNNRMENNGTSSVTGTCKSVEVAIASDYGMISKYGLGDVESRNIAIVNLLHVYYDNAQIGSIWLSFQVVGQYFSTSSAADPLIPAYTGTDANTLLTNFTAWGQAGSFGFSYDVAQMWTATDFQSGGNFGVIGLAWVGGTCSSNRYMLLEDFAPDILSLAGMTAHETGHNLGAQHDNSGDPFIMAPSIAYPPNTNFSAASLTAMANYTSGTGGSCFSSCGTVLPMAAFVASSKNVCAGSSVTFTDYSLGETSRTWTFTGGNISSSTAANPSVSYSSPGIKMAKLSITGAGALTSEITKYIMVFSAPPPITHTSITGDNTTPVLSGFKLAGINHPGSSPIFLGGRYTDNSCLENTRLMPGTTYTVDFRVGIFDASCSTKLQMLIDYNGDNDFLDANENVYVGTTCYYNNNGGPYVEFSFTTPASPATNKFLRLRLIALPCALAATNGQSIYSNSQVEDYAVYFPSVCPANISVSGTPYTCSTGTYQISGIDPATNGNNIYWVGPTGSTVISGQGTTTATISFPANFVSGTVSAYFDGCDAANSVRTFDVSSLPPQTAISGAANLCNLASPTSTTTYSISAVTGANNYQWTIPTGGTLVSGQGTNSVQVSFASNFSSGNMQVVVTTPCGNTTQTLAITKSLATLVSQISGPSNLCSLPTGANTATYSVTSLPGSLTYIWSAPPSTGISSGQNTSSLVLFIGSSFSSGTLNLSVSGCGTAANRNIGIQGTKITASAGNGGTISQAGVTYICPNANQTYTITPNACYSISNVTVDGVSQGAINSYTFTNVTANHTISASFVLNMYTITVTAGANGSISPGTSPVICGTDAVYTITPDPCYAITNVSVDGVSQGTISSYTFTNVQANHTISATFTALGPFMITASIGPHGTVTPGTTMTVNCASNVTYNITPDPCYRIGNVLVDGIPKGPVSSYTFINVQANHDILVFFVLNTYTITATAGALGSISPGTGSVNCGSNATYTITPQAGNGILDVLVDGVSQGAISSYTFNNVQATHTIGATFGYVITPSWTGVGAILPFNPVVVSAGGGTSFSINASSCYRLQDLLVDNVSVGPVTFYTFTNVTASHTLKAIFVQKTYTITATAGASGSITGASTVTCGSDYIYTITAATGAVIKDVLVDGISQGAISSYTFTDVQADHTISATFGYVITPSWTGVGAILPFNPVVVSAGGGTSFSINASSCYRLQDLLVDNVSVGPVTFYTFTNVTASHTLKAIFVQKTYTITATAGASGSITGASTVTCGSDYIYTITAATGAVIKDVLVDGISQGAIGSYTFTDVQTDHTISAIFGWKITLGWTGAGIIIPFGTGSVIVAAGSNQGFTMEGTTDCSTVQDLLVDGVSVGAQFHYTFTNVTTNHTIQAVFGQFIPIVTATAGPGGSITAPASLICGSDAVYTIVPDPCYSIANVVVDGISQGAIGAYTFTGIRTYHTISATFVLNTYTITASAGANGSITPATSSINCGSNTTYTITPNACYSIADVIVDGVSQGAIGTYTFTNVATNHTISAIFVLNTYAITVSAAANGTITPATGSVNCGTNATYTITPNNGYSITDVVVDGVSQGAIGTYTFTNVTANHSISATFVNSAMFTITANAGANGSISPNAATVVNSGANQSYTITPNACYHVQNVLVDGVSAGAITSYNFNNITADHMISVTFVQDPALTVSVSGPVNVCGYIGTGNPVVYTVTSEGATGFSWVLPPNVNVVSGAGTANLAVTFDPGFENQGNKQLRITALSTCGNSPQKIYYLVAQLPGTPKPITAGNNNICSVLGTTGTISYTINAVPAATAYNWTAQSGTTIINHPNGLGVNDTTVTVSFNNDFTSSSIAVSASNGCGTSNARSLAIVRSNPPTPGLISGPTNACQYMSPNGMAAAYSINPIAIATSYTWSLPADVTNVNDVGSNTVSFVYPNGFVSGTVSVVANNGCGTSVARTLSIGKLNPATPGIIDVIQVQFCPNRVYSYTLATMPLNATSVNWTIPAGATIQSGQGTRSILVSYPSSAVSGNVTAQAFSNCASSTTRISTVRLPACPPDVPFAGKGITNSSIVQSNLDVAVFPNPTTTDFKLRVLTADKEKIDVVIIDLQGRVVKSIALQPYETIMFGAEIKAGTYIMRVKQANNTTTQKLVKF